MDYGQLIAQDIAEAEAFAQWKQHARPVLPAVSTEVFRQLVLLRQEIAHVAALAFFNASISNWLVWHPDKTVRTSQKFFKPSVSALADNAIAACAEQEQCFDLLPLWQDLKARLSFAVEFSGGIVPAGLTDATSAATRELLSDVWRRACASLLDVHMCVAEMMEGCAPAREAEQETRMLQALKESADGGWPCITPDGELQVPGWADRRRAQRRLVKALVTFEHGSRIEQGTLLDVSPDGLKIATSHKVPEGERLTVVLPGGQRRSGTIVWSDGQRIGVQLSEPLDVDAIDLAV